MLASGAAIGLPQIGSAAESAAVPAKRSYSYHGRPDDYTEFRVIEPGRVIQKIETFNQGMFAIVRVTTADGQEGYGQIATYETEISVLTLHRKIAPLVLGKDPADIDAIVDHCIDANHKFPWSFICRAIGGVDTAIWDLYGRIKQKPVAELLGGKVRPLPAYGSSMSRTISPEDEAARLVKLRDTQGFRGFKIRVAKENGHDRDAAPGRSEKIIPTVRKALGDDIALKADANSGFTPPRAIAIGRILEDQRLQPLRRAVSVLGTGMDGGSRRRVENSGRGRRAGQRPRAMAAHDSDERRGHRAAGRALPRRHHARLAGGIAGAARGQNRCAALGESFNGHAVHAAPLRRHAERRPDDGMEHRTWRHEQAGDGAFWPESVREGRPGALRSRPGLGREDQSGVVESRHVSKE